MTDAEITREFEDAGGTAAGILATLLVAVGFEGIYTYPPSALYAPEPIVIGLGAWEREARLSDGEGERGLVRLDVSVVRDCRAVAEAMAHKVERTIRKGRWEGRGDGWHVRMTGIDTGAPAVQGTGPLRTLDLGLLGMDDDCEGRLSMSEERRQDGRSLDRELGAGTRLARQAREEWGRPPRHAGITSDVLEQRKATRYGRARGRE